MDGPKEQNYVVSKYYDSIIQFCTLEMNRLQLPHAKLFYMIAELSKKQYIDDTQKRMLKEKTISDDIEIFKLLDKYEKSKNEDDLANGLISLAKPSPSFGLSLQGVQNKQQEKPSDVNVQSSTQEKKEQEQMKADDFGIDINQTPQATSPVGTSLHLRKYQHSLNLNNQINRQILQPCKASSDDANP